MKPRIEKYYIDEGLTLAQTTNAMRNNEGFNATEKMYKTRIKRWEWTKYIKDDKAIEVLSGGNNGLSRSATIAGRPVTVEEARRHLKRKKVNTWSPVQPHATLDTTANTIDEGMITSPDDEQAPFYNGAVFPITSMGLIDNAMAQQNGFTPNTGFTSNSGFTLNGFIMKENMTNRYFEQADDDADMMDVDSNDFGDQPMWTIPETSMILRQNRQRSPSLLLTPGLSIQTESFLHSMSDFCSLTLNSMAGNYVQSEADRRFNKLWDLFCTKATHMQHNRQSQALTVRNDAYNTFSTMLQNGDPWLLLSLCLVINDNLSKPTRIAASTSFLSDLATWASSSASDHPITRLVSYLLQTNDRGLMLLEGTVRMITEKLNSTLGVHHELSLELSRLYSRILTEIDMHSTADKLLSQDLAGIEQICGSDSLQNLLRKSSLARCRYMVKDFFGSLRLYQQILAAPLLKKDFLADVKYGAMYFVAKSNAQIGRYDNAIAEAEAALQFSLEKQGPDHYWANNAREMIREFEAARSKNRFELVE